MATDASFGLGFIVSAQPIPPHPYETLRKPIKNKKHRLKSIEDERKKKNMH
jgi:hypothetical protein